METDYFRLSEQFPDLGFSSCSIPPPWTPDTGPSAGAQRPVVDYQETDKGSRVDGEDTRASDGEIIKLLHPNSSASEVPASLALYSEIVNFTPLEPFVIKPSSGLDTTESSSQIKAKIHDLSVMTNDPYHRTLETPSLVPGTATHATTTSRVAFPTDQGHERSPANKCPANDAHVVDSGTEEEREM